MAGADVDFCVTTAAGLPAASGEVDLVLRAVPAPPPGPAPSPGGQPDRPVLSAREQQVLAAIAGGFTHAQIARRMYISVATVNTYVARVRTKLGVGNKAELTRAAFRYLDPALLTGSPLGVAS
jgi:DNA-binding NarL/FixJ family response regulator